MTTDHASNNLPPHPWRWQQRAVHQLDFPLGKLLDFGCGEGRLLISVHQRCAECHGVDVRTDVLDALRLEHPEFKLKTIGFDGKTDYPDDFFDTIAIIEVIEHVANERETLTELARILKPGGKLLLTTPHKGLLTFIDVGNVKFVLPRLHRLAHWMHRKPDSYRQRFEDKHDGKLVGDITVSEGRRPWHRHYRAKEIHAHCPANLLPLRHGVYFPGMRAFMFLKVALRVACFRLFAPFPPPLPWLEKKLSQVESKHGDQLVMWFEKRAENQR